MNPRLQPCPAPSCLLSSRLLPELRPLGPGLGSTPAAQSLWILRLKGELPGALRFAEAAAVIWLLFTSPSLGSAGLRCFPATECGDLAGIKVSFGDR